MQDDDSIREIKGDGLAVYSIIHILQVYNADLILFP